MEDLAGEFLYYVKGLEDRESVMSDGCVKLIARLPSNTIQLPQGLSVSPEGQSILYSAGWRPIHRG